MHTDLYLPLTDEQKAILDGNGLHGSVAHDVRAGYGPGTGASISSQLIVIDTDNHRAASTPGEKNERDSSEDSSDSDGAEDPTRASTAASCDRDKDDAGVFDWPSSSSQQRTRPKQTRRSDSCSDSENSESSNDLDDEAGDAHDGQASSAATLSGRKIRKQKRKRRKENHVSRPQKPTLPWTDDTTPFAFETLRAHVHDMLSAYLADYPQHNSPKIRGQMEAIAMAHLIVLKEQCKIRKKAERNTSDKKKPEINKHCTANLRKHVLLALALIALGKYTTAAPGTDPPANELDIERMKTSIKADHDANKLWRLGALEGLQRIKDSCGRESPISRLKFMRDCFFQLHAVYVNNKKEVFAIQAGGVNKPDEARCERLVHMVQPLVDSFCSPGNRSPDAYAAKSTMARRPVSHNGSETHAWIPWESFRVRHSSGTEYLVVHVYLRGISPRTMAASGVFGEFSEAAKVSKNESNRRIELAFEMPDLEPPLLRPRDFTTGGLPSVWALDVPNDGLEEMVSHLSTVLERNPAAALSAAVVERSDGSPQSVLRMGVKYRLKIDLPHVEEGFLLDYIPTFGFVYFFRIAKEKSSLLKSNTRANPYAQRSTPPHTGRLTQLQLEPQSSAAAASSAALGTQLTMNSFSGAANLTPPRPAVQLTPRQARAQRPSFYTPPDLMDMKDEQLEPGRSRAEHLIRGGRMCAQCTIALRQVSTEEDDPEKVTYAECNGCKRWWHKDCIFFANCLLSTTPLDERDPWNLGVHDNLTFYCSRCVFCHAKKCLMGHEKRGLKDVTDYTLSDWKPYWWCELCAVVVHDECARAEGLTCGYCSRTLVEGMRVEKPGKKIEKRSAPPSRERDARKKNRSTAASTQQTGWESIIRSKRAAGTSTTAS